jgi:hypothetical protein
MHDLHRPLKNKHILPRILHQVLAQPVDEEADVDGLICRWVYGRENDFVGSLRGEEEFEAAAVDGIRFHIGVRQGGWTYVNSSLMGIVDGIFVAGLSEDVQLVVEGR